MALPQADSPPSQEFVPWYKDWKTSAATGILVGMTISVAEAVAKIDIETCIKRKQYRFARQLARPLIVGGVLGGVCDVTYTSVLNYLNEKRGVVDVHNFAASVAVAGGAFGLMAPAAVFPPGIRPQRVLAAMVSSVYFGVVSYPLVWAYLKLDERHRVYIEDLSNKSGRGKSEQCDEAQMKDQEAV